MKRFIVMFVGVFTGLLLASVVLASCPPDSVQVGPVCVDKYEASVWETTDASLVALIQSGLATQADLISGGAVQRGVSSNDYPCNIDGNDCATIYAVSISGVTPSSFITWFQAQQAAANSGKRLVTNAEWQMAAAGTPDPGGAPGPADCNTTSNAKDLTGARANCVSRWGAFDMVGNVWEWVADWVPRSTDCVMPLFADDANCLAGASTTLGPGALIRGGFFHDDIFGGGASAGVFAVDGRDQPSVALDRIGLRAAR